MKKLAKTTKWLQMAAVLALTLLFAVGTAVTAKAAVSKPTGVKQIDAGSSNVKITWNAIMADDAYIWYKISDSQDMVNFRSARIGKTNYSTNTTISGLNNGTAYYVSIGIAENDRYSSSAMPENIVWSDVVEVVTEPGDLPNDNISFDTASETTISLSWVPVNGATSYRVVYYEENVGKEENASSVVADTNSVAITGLKNNTKYRVKIYPQKTSAAGYLAEGRNTYGYKMDVPTLPTKIEGVGCDYFNTSVKKGEARFSWNENKNADGYIYEIYAYNGKKPLITEEVNKYYYDYAKVDSKKLNTRQMYKIRVRAYINTSNNQRVYGAWSSYNYFCRSVGEDISMKKSGNAVKLSWKKVKGATGYTVYMASTKGYSSNRTFKKVGTAKKTNFTIKKKFKKGYDYYFRIVPIYKKGKTKGEGVVNTSNTYAGYMWSSGSGKWYFSK